LPRYLYGVPSSNFRLRFCRHNANLNAEMSLASAPFDTLTPEAHDRACNPTLRHLRHVFLIKSKHQTLKIRHVVYIVAHLPFLTRKQRPIPLAVRFKAWFCSRLLVGVAGSNPVGGMGVCCELSGRGLCVGLITRPEESYRLWVCVCVWV